MTAKKSSSLKIKHVLVISDQERLLGLFDFDTEFSGTQFTLVTSIAEGIKAAKKDAPFLLFIQGRIGGFSADIIARHIILELKDSTAKIVLLCVPEDIPASANKAVYGSIDISQEDDVLHSQVQSVVNSALHGEKKTIPAQRKTAGVKSATSPSRKRTPIEPKLIEPLSQHLNPHHDRGDVVDVVEVGTESTTMTDDDMYTDVPLTGRATAGGSNFAEQLNDALGKRLVLPPEEIPQPAEVRSRNSVKVALAVAAVAVIGICLLYHYKSPASLKMTERDFAAPAPSQPAKPLKEQIPEKKPQAPLTGYMKYKVRRGDTILSILKGRFGFSETEAQKMIPEIRAKNGIARSSALRIGQSIYIPVSLEEPPVSVRPVAPTAAPPVPPKASAPVQK